MRRDRVRTPPHQGTTDWHSRERYDLQINDGPHAKLVSMVVRFTKRAEGRHRLTIVRDDASLSRGQLIPGLGPNAIPHDLLHAVVEKTLGFSRGVYGMVNTGLDIVELLDPAQKRINKGEAELMYSEIITTVLQAETAYVGLDETFFGDELRQRCAEAGLAEPKVTSQDQRELRRLRDEYRGRWQALGVGETIDVELPGSRTYKLPRDAHQDALE